jgi:hypothetical protein
MCATTDDILFTLTSDTKIMTFHRNFLEVTTMHNWQKTRPAGCCTTATVELDEPDPEDRLRESRVIPRFEFAGATLTREENKDAMLNASASEVRPPPTAPGPRAPPRRRLTAVLARARPRRPPARPPATDARSAQKLRKMWTLRLLTTPIKEQSFDASMTMANAPQACQMLTP